ncbi:major capsid protein [Comamonas sp. lk]|uniref:major capsid protein n=1 Tax=Comamonas sp. lk TaxID=2201272 RepID=UPI000EB19C9A|nr:major capsid protein [Comamonas sp. lk]
MKKSLKAALVAIPAFAMATASHAAIDVTGVVTEITGSKDPVGLIGMAILGVAVTLATFLWIRRAIK